MNNDIDKRAISKLYDILPRTDIDYLLNHSTEGPPKRCKVHASYVAYCMVAGIVCHLMIEPAFAGVVFASAIFLAIYRGIYKIEAATTKDTIILVTVFVVVTSIYLPPVLGTTDWIGIILISLFGATIEYASVLYLFAVYWLVVGD